MFACDSMWVTENVWSLILAGSKMTSMVPQVMLAHTSLLPNSKTVQVLSNIWMQGVNTALPLALSHNWIDLKTFMLSQPMLRTSRSSRVFDDGRASIDHLTVLYDR